MFYYKYNQKMNKVLFCFTYYFEGSVIKVAKYVRACYLRSHLQVFLSSPDCKRQKYDQKIRGMGITVAKYKINNFYFIAILSVTLAVKERSGRELNDYMLIILKKQGKTHKQYVFGTSVRLKMTSKTQNNNFFI